MTIKYRMTIERMIGLYLFSEDMSLLLNMDLLSPIVEKQSRGASGRGCNGRDVLSCNISIKDGKGNIIIII
jgi:hypothetical protein